MSLTAGEIEAAPVLHLTETGSTNEDALVRGRAGEPGPFWIRADRQASGRGRQGRAWDSPWGNLYCSLMLRVAADPRDLPQLSQVAAVALADAIEAATGPRPALRIKWPNDLLLDGAKLAGILVEATRSAGGDQLCVVGCGVNCAAFPDGLPYRATSLAAHGAVLAPGDLFGQLKSAMGRALAVWDDGRGFAAIRGRWLDRALPAGTPLTVRSERTPLTGRFQGIDERGRLLLLGPNGPVTVEAGDVDLKQSSAAPSG